MLDKLLPLPEDALLALIKKFAADPREEKIDLGVGVFRTDEGNTPVLRAMKEAERILLETQDSKKYLGPEGDLGFVEALKPVIFKNPADDRITGVQTPGGSGALRLAADMLNTIKNGATIWVGEPTWPNHKPIAKEGHLTIKSFDYFDLKTQTVLFDSMVAALESADAGDIVLLQACCHNPTGADLSIEQWKTVSEIIVRKGLFPLVDFAYQGLGKGLEEDAAGLHILMDAVDEALIAYSCDKNFGLYRERTGALYAYGRTADDALKALSNMASLARTMWSMPPDHGAAAARIILQTPALEKMWREEVAEMNARVVTIRNALAEKSDKLAFLAEQNGMFSNLPVTKEQVVMLREEHAIYMAGSGRINLAGLRFADVGRFCDAVVPLLG